MRINGFTIPSIDLTALEREPCEQRTAFITRAFRQDRGRNRREIALCLLHLDSDMSEEEWFELCEREAGRSGR